MQCVAVCCCVLQRDSIFKMFDYDDMGQHDYMRQVCCSVLQCVAVCFSVLQCVVRCVAVCCSVLQCVAA